jgi:hypothetical protein
VDAPERTLYHQIHPAKLATDLVAEVVSVRLFWRHLPLAGFAVHLVPPVVASAIVTRRTAELERIKASPAGRYIQAEMTPPMVALRVVGDTVTVVGAWRRQPLVIAAGALLVVAGWTLGPRSDHGSDTHTLRDAPRRLVARSSSTRLVARLICDRRLAKAVRAVGYRG